MESASPEKVGGARVSETTGPDSVHAGGSGTPSRDSPQSLKTGPPSSPRRQQTAPGFAPFAWQAIAHWAGVGATAANHAGAKTAKARKTAATRRMRKRDVIRVFSSQFLRNQTQRFRGAGSPPGSRASRPGAGRAG